jgi:hypothetical protein
MSGRELIFNSAIAWTEMIETYGTHFKYKLYFEVGDKKYYKPLAFQWLRSTCSTSDAYKPAIAIFTTLINLDLLETSEFMYNNAEAFIEYCETYHEYTT